MVSVSVWQNGCLASFYKKDKHGNNVHVHHCLNALEKISFSKVLSYLATFKENSHNKISIFFLSLGYLTVLLSYWRKTFFVFLCVRALLSWAYTPPSPVAAMNFNAWLSAGVADWMLVPRALVQRCGRTWIIFFRTTGKIIGTVSENLIKFKWSRP